MTADRSDDMSARLFVQIYTKLLHDEEMIETSYGALGVFVTALLIAKDTATDGVIPVKLLRRDAALRADGDRLQDYLDELSAASKIGSDSDSDRISVRSWSKYNKLVGDIAADRRRKKEASLRANHKRWHVDASSPKDDCPLCLAEGLVDLFPLATPHRIPVGSQSDPDPSPVGSDSESIELELELEPQQELELIPADSTSDGTDQSKPPAGRSCEDPPPFVFTGKMPTPPPDEATETALRFAAWFHEQASIVTPLDELQAHRKSWNENWFNPCQRLTRSKGRDWLRNAVAVTFADPEGWLARIVVSPRVFEQQISKVADAIEADKRDKAKSQTAPTTTKVSTNGDWSGAWSQVSRHYRGELAPLLRNQTIPRPARVVAWLTGKQALDGHGGQWAYRDAWNTAGDTTRTDLPPHIAALIDGGSDEATTTEGLTA